MDSPSVAVEEVCPTCHRRLEPVSRGVFGGSRLHAELWTFRCPEHGDVFVTREAVPGSGPDNIPDPDGDAPVRVPRGHAPRNDSGSTTAAPTESN